jgi:hypothetical protein
MLRELPYRDRALIVCDCEGYELELFSEETLLSLSRHDLLIEVHDCINPNISSILSARIENTHELEVIPSVDDAMKVQTYYYDELQSYQPTVRRVLLGEYRYGPMAWFFLTSRHRA